jgi:hypothetical protein
LKRERGSFRNEQNNAAASDSTRWPFPIPGKEKLELLAEYEEDDPAAVVGGDLKPDLSFEELLLRQDLALGIEAGGDVGPLDGEVFMELDSFGP